MCNESIDFAIQHRENPDGTRWVCVLPSSHSGPHFATFNGIGYLADCACDDCRVSFVEEYPERFIIEWEDNGQIIQWSDGDRLYYGGATPRQSRLMHLPVRVSEKDRRLVKARKLP